MNNQQPKVIVIGIDGGSWNIIDKFIDNLPNFKRIREDGFATDLLSTIPPVTCPAWKSYSTGKNQDELGIYWWGHVDFEKGSINFFSSLDFKHEEIWDTLNKFGYRSLVINLPLSYPPKKINGMLIAGFPAADADSYTYPSELKKELIQKFQYRIHPKHHIELFKEKTVQEIYSIIQTRFDVLYHYLNKDNYDFAHVTIFYTDDIQHYQWSDEKAILGAYQIIDANLGNIMVAYPHSNIIIMSDHGFQQTKDSFFINNFLFEKGLLMPQKHKSTTISKLSTTVLQNDILMRIINYLFMSLPRKKQIKLKKLFLPGEDEFSIEKSVDLKESLVVGTKQGPIFINTKKLQEKALKYTQFTNNLKDELFHIKTPDNTQLVKEIFEVKAGKDSPKFIIIPNEGYEIEIQLNKEQVLWKSELNGKEGWVAHHRPQGIFLAHGKDISKIIFPNPMRIHHIARRILQLYNIPKEYFQQGKKVLPSKKNLQKVISGLHVK